MRFKLPWQHDRVAPPTEPSSIPNVVSMPALETGADDAAHGSEILASTQVETVELGDLAKLPPFRPVVISLVRLFDRDDVKIDEVASLVAADPSMVSELLAVVNSPLFGFRQNITSPSHAVTLLGMERTKSLSATLAMRSLMQGAPRTPVVRRFWLHSLATATIARHFARAYGADPELSYVAALMHDLGRSGLLAAHPEEYSRLALTAHACAAEILQDEEAAFQMTHCGAGSLLARAWHLPGTFREVAAHHHEAGSEQPVVALAQLACRLADDLMFQSIHRSDIQKPAETITQFAPERLHAFLISELDAASAAVDAAIQTLDF